MAAGTWDVSAVSAGWWDESADETGGGFWDADALSEPPAEPPPPVVRLTNYASVKTELSVSERIR